nr:MAG TPA: hypothetical protein [Bacteriophage sp.]
MSDFEDISAARFCVAIVIPPFLFNNFSEILSIPFPFPKGNTVVLPEVLPRYRCGSDFLLFRLSLFYKAHAICDITEPPQLLRRKFVSALAQILKRLLYFFRHCVTPLSYDIISPCFVL